MGHPTHLLERIRDLVASDYPEHGGFRYSFEENIKQGGRRYQPDIIVRAADGTITCLVEIGYTRPEKLTLYRKTLRVADVRWYDKEGKLHGDVEHRSIVERHSVTYDVADDLEIRTVPIQAVPCPSCLDEFARAEPAEDDPDACQGCLSAGGGPCDDCLDANIHEACGGSYTWAMFSATHYAVVVECDACGAVTPALEEDVPDTNRADLLQVWSLARRTHDYGESPILCIQTGKDRWPAIEAVLAPHGIDFSDFKRFADSDWRGAR